MVREREEMSDEIKVLRRLLRPEAGHSESP
jgi:hypothetical protein